MKRNGRATRDDNPNREGYSSWMPARWTMTDQWYYAHQGQRAGPVSPEQLRQAAATGQLLKTDQVWKKGMAGWASAEKVKGLFPSVVQIDPDEPPPLPTDVPSPSLSQPPASNGNTHRSTTSRPQPTPPFSTATLGGVRCPRCAGMIAHDSQYAGRDVGCPHCNAKVIMPVRPANATQAVAESGGSEFFDFLRPSASSGTPQYLPDTITLSPGHHDTPMRVHLADTPWG